MPLQLSDPIILNLKFIEILNKTSYAGLRKAVRYEVFQVEEGQSSCIKMLLQDKIQLAHNTKAYWDKSFTATTALLKANNHKNSFSFR